jgi:hypothetical protein
MATFFANLMPWIVLLWSLSFIWFIDKIKTQFLGQKGIFNVPDIQAEYDAIKSDASGDS